MEYRNYGKTESTSSIFGKLFFSYVTPMYALGNKRDYVLAEEDLLKSSPVDKPEVIADEFEAILKAKLKEDNGSCQTPVTDSLKQQFRKPMIRAGFVKFINSTIQFAPPIFLAQLLGCLETNDKDLAWLWACLLVLVLMMKTITENNYFHRVVRVGFNIRTALTTAVYRKSLVISPSGKQEIPVGQIMNLMQLDAQRLEMLMMHLHVLWDGPYQLIVNIILLGIYSTWQATLAGVGVIILMMPITAVFMSRIGKYRREIVKYNDRRVKLTTEALTGYRAIKLYGWEVPFLNRINAVRDDELRGIRNYAIQNALSVMVMTISPIVISIVNLIVFSLTDEAGFTSSRVFTAITVLNQVRFTVMFMPMLIQQLADSKVALKRLNEYMRLPNVGLISELDPRDKLTPEAAAHFSMPASEPSEVPSVATFAEFSEPYYSSSVRALISESKAYLASNQTEPTTSSDIVRHSRGEATSPFAVTVSEGVFYWEDPHSREARLQAKAKEERAKKLKDLRGRRAGADGSQLSKRARSAEAAELAASPLPAPSHFAPVLRGVSLAVPRGQLWAVIGPVGCGKSALLSSLLGELATAGGLPRLNGRVAFVSQTAWVLNASLRENVCFARRSILGEHAVFETLRDSSGSGAEFARKSVSISSQDLDRSMYDVVLDAAQLRPDLAILPDGDQTEIGERGINLSGGQKQRVSLARAAFSGADIVLFDDPLSALDAEVGKKVFDELICDLLGGTTRLLVTNALQYLEKCDGVIVLNQLEGVGRVVAQGHFNELMALPAFREMMERYGHDEEEKKKNIELEKAKEDEDVIQLDDVAPADPETEKRKREEEEKAATEKALALVNAADSTKKASSGGHGHGHGHGAAPPSDVTKAGGHGHGHGAAGTTPKSLMTVEQKKQGAVDRKYYVRYFQYTGSAILSLITLFFFYALSTVAQVISQWWVTFWTMDPMYQDHGKAFYMGIYAALGVATGITAFVRSIVLALAAIRSSRRMHSEILHAIIEAPVSLMDTTPQGRLTQLISRDLDQIDTVLVSTLSFFFMAIFNLLGTAAAIIFSTPWFAVVMPFVTFIYIFVMKYYTAVSREVKRWESISKSPVYSHFSETLGGLSVLRAYGLQAPFAKRNTDNVERNLAAWYSLKCSDRWLSVRLESLGNMIVLAAAFLAIGTASNRSDGTVAGLAGLSLSFAMSITGLLSWAVRHYAETEQVMNSVERLSHYIDDVESEPYDAPRPRPFVLTVDGQSSNAVVDIVQATYAKEVELVAPKTLNPHISTSKQRMRKYGRAKFTNPVCPPNWPSAGALEFKDYRMRYRPGTPEVLHGVTFSVPAGSKVGIIGRTGSGKSSLIASLFRLIEDDCHTGLISIDGVDIDTVGIAALRKSLSIVPQDPVMFSGTIRTNLDPAQLVSDDNRLWDALEKVGLQGLVQRLPGGLDAPVAEYGDSLSVGQRQLICLARVLLLNSKIVVFDEASSSLDAESDLRMQNVIRDHFADCTILTIAHRLHTIITSDKILVMNAGLVSEFDAPYVLLSNENSMFTALINELGEKTANALKERAKEAYFTHNQ